MVNRVVPIILDDSIDMEFGTGCVKITPAHDFNDYKLGKKHNLDFINILNKDGTFNDNVSDLFVGMNIHESRNIVIDELKKLGRFDKAEEYKTTIPIGERSGESIEFKRFE